MGTLIILHSKRKLKSNLYQELSHIFHCKYVLLSEIFNINTSLHVFSYLEKKPDRQSKKTIFNSIKDRLGCKIVLFT
jgi:hypothetical protein